MAGLEINPLVQQQVYRANTVPTPPSMQAAAQAMASNFQPRPLAPPVPTLTAQAASATGRAEATRDTRSGTETAQSVDTGAGASRAQATGGNRRRGSLLDLSI